MTKNFRRYLTQTTAAIATAVVLVGCGPAQESTPRAEKVNPYGRDTAINEGAGDRGDLRGNIGTNLGRTTGNTTNRTGIAGNTIGNTTNRARFNENTTNTNDRIGLNGNINNTNDRIELNGNTTNTNDRIGLNGNINNTNDRMGLNGNTTDTNDRIGLNRNTTNTNDRIGFNGDTTRNTTDTTGLTNNLMNRRGTTGAPTIPGDATREDNDSIFGPSIAGRGFIDERNNTQNNNGNEVNNGNQDTTVSARAEGLADEITKMNEVEEADVIITNNSAVVGVKLNGNNNETQITNIKNKIQRRVKELQPSITSVSVTNSPDLVNRIGTLSNRIRTNNNETDFTNEVNELFRNITPTI